MCTYYSEYGSYDETYHVHDAEARIWVDCKLGGEAKVVLVEGERTCAQGAFHAATDAHSSELQTVGWMFCEFLEDHVSRRSKTQMLRPRMVSCTSRS